jgi:Domain of Unknown Function with PDB structure (DUF3857)
VILPNLLLIAASAVGPQDAASPAQDASEHARVEVIRCRERVEADGNHTITLETATLLRTAAAVASFGQIALPYVDGYGDITYESVAIDKADGRHVDVANGLVEDVNPYGVTDTSIAADIHFKKLTVPGLEPGDRLSYRVVFTQKPLAPGSIFGGMKFSQLPGDPLQTYELDLPRNAPIRVSLREGLGTTWEDVPAGPDRLVRRLSLKVERPKPEKPVDKRALTELDVIFTSFSSWGDVGRWWWGLSRDA